MTVLWLITMNWGPRQPDLHSMIYTYTFTHSLTSVHFYGQLCRGDNASGCVAGVQVEVLEAYFLAHLCTPVRSTRTCMHLFILISDTRGHAAAPVHTIRVPPVPISEIFSLRPFQFS